MGCMFITINRGKRSIALDLKTPAARAVLLRLAESADVLVTNIRPAAMARLGLDYAAVRAANPRIVYAERARLCAGRALWPASRPMTT